MMAWWSQSLTEGGVTTAEQSIYRFAEEQQRDRRGTAKGTADDKRMKCQVGCPSFVAGSERAADGGGDASTHRTARHHLLQHDQRKRQCEAS